MYVYVVVEEHDYEGCNQPDSVHSTYEKAHERAIQLMPKHRISGNEEEGEWLYYLSNWSYNIHIFKMKVE